MLKFKLSSVLRVRGIEKPFAFLQKRGFYRTVASNLINDKTISIKISQIETLCRALNCTPNDLFEFEPNANDTISVDHPLNSLNRQLNSSKIQKVVREIPLDKLDKVEEFIAQLKKE